MLFMGCRKGIMSLLFIFGWCSCGAGSWGYTMEGVGRGFKNGPWLTQPTVSLRNSMQQDVSMATDLLGFKRTGLLAMVAAWARSRVFHLACLGVPVARGETGRSRVAALLGPLCAKGCRPRMDEGECTSQRTGILLFRKGTFPYRGRVSSSARGISCNS